MKKPNDFKIGTKIALAVILVMIVSLTLNYSILLINLYQANKANAEKLAVTISKANAAQLSQNLDTVKTIVRGLENSILYAHQTKTMNRQQIIELLRITLEKSPIVLGVYTLWEPDLFDGNDPAYRNRPGYDGTGRFIPYVVRSKGKIILEPLKDYETEGAGDYYQIPKRTKKISLLEPFSYQIGGQDVLMTSMVFPLLDDKGNFLGIVGADIDLTFMRDLVAKTKPMDGYSYLNSTKGIYLAHGAAPKLVMQDAAKQSGNWPAMIEKTSRGEEVITYDTSEATRQKILRVMEPVHLEGTNEYWSFGSAIPEKTIFSQFNSLFALLIISFLIMIGLFALVILYMNRRIVTMPLRKTVEVLVEMSKGHLTQRLAVQSRDEVGELALAMNAFADHLKSNVVEAMEQISQGNTSAETPIIDAQDEIGPPLQKMIVTLRELIAEANMLTNAAARGQLSTRGNADKFQGGYREIVMGINKTLDTVIEPLHEANAVLTNMAVNDYTRGMTGEYQGELKQFSANVNFVHTNLCSVQNVILQVAQGDTSRLEEFRQIVKRSENDKMIPAIIAMMETIRNLINEARRLADAAIQGNLNERSDASQFEGGYSDVIHGFNTALNAIAGPINEASDVLRAMAQGNLTVAMNGVYQGNYGEIKESLNLTVESFHNVLIDINNAALQVAAGARQIAVSAQTLSQGSTEQASAIEELTVSIDQIAAQTKQNARYANEANQLAITAKEEAEQGNGQMQKMLQAMDNINEASASIAKIIKVIDEIAFQTNILALNAAVEAARAGQHGKGFAVVAEEVRHLAARSAEAAQETTALIEGSIKKAENGTMIANGTAQALNKIVNEVTKVTALVGQIAAASNEQATGIAQINQGVEQVAQVTQTTTATSEENAAASEELSGQAEILSGMVQQFKLNPNSGNKRI